MDFDFDLEWSQMEEATIRDESDFVLIQHANDDLEWWVQQLVHITTIEAPTE